jgi:hypothetical protein
MDYRNRSRKRNRITGAVLLAVSLLVILFALWSTIYRTESFTIRSTLLANDIRIAVTYPILGMVGETAEVKVSLRSGGSSSSEGAGVLIVGEIQSGSLSVQPSGQISQMIAPGKGTTFTWHVETSRTGRQEIRLFIFKEGVVKIDSTYLQQPLWARLFIYQTYPGLAGLKFFLLYLAAFTGLIGLGLVVRNSLR